MPEQRNGGSGHSSIRLLLVTPNFDNNSLGRTYCLWLLAKELGWSARIVGVVGGQIWRPLRDTPFAADCRPLAHVDQELREAALREEAAWSDAVLAVKPLPASLGIAEPLAAPDRPLLVDIDDPDIEFRLSWQPLRRRIRDRVSLRRRELIRLRGLTRTIPVSVSNPVLQDWYGGVIIPHVRAQAGPPQYQPCAEGAVVIRFVGSPWGHKGIDVLRRSIGRLRETDPELDVRLEVTADPPADAAQWENWVGQTSFEDGQKLVASADLIVLPSLAESWSLGQLPAKLMDAMMQGRPVIASDLAPLRWALGDTGLLVPPGDVTALTAAIRELADPKVRRELGLAAYERAVAAFGVASVAPRFEEHVLAALGRRTEAAKRIP